MLRTVLFLLCVALAPAAASAEGRVKIVDQKAEWELAYGLVLHRVIGHVENVSDEAVPFVHLKVEWLAADGSVVHAMDAFNQSAEGLGMVEASERAEMLGDLEPLAPGGKELFRVGIAKDELPKSPRFVMARATIVEPEADPSSVVPELVAAEPPADDALNLNEASEKELLALPGMTKARAIALRQHVAKNGPLLQLDELRILPQILPIYDDLLPLVRID